MRRAQHHVAFHLMPVYADPKLLDGVSAGLRKHLTGKTTFTFASVEPDLFAELDGLTAPMLRRPTRLAAASRRAHRGVTISL